MFTTQEIIGDIVYVSFADKERYKDIGLDLQSGHFKILGYDNIGLWVEHPYLLENKTTNKKIKSNFVITWDNVITACSECNTSKGNKTLKELRISIKQEPFEPSISYLQEKIKKYPPNYLHESWKDFLYWDTELEN